MREKLGSMKNKRQLESILLVFVLVVTGMVVVFPLTAPKAKAYDHLESAMAEDGDPTYDADGAMNGIVLWHNPGGSGEDHIISANYMIEPGYTLNIPALDFTHDPDTQSVVYFDPTDISGFRMDVYGKLTTNSGGPFTRTAFMSKTGSWEGIYFHSGSQCRIAGSLFRGSVNGLVFEPGSSLSAIDFTFFDQMKGQGVQMDGVLGSPSISKCSFDDSAYDLSTALDVANGDLKITGTTFVSHADNKSQLHISNADVYAYDVNFVGSNQPGNLVHIEGNSNGTELHRCKLQIGSAGDHYIRADGCSPFIDNCSFETTHGERSVIANDKNGISAHLIVRNATGVLPGIENFPFDNSTINATGGSSITLQWFMNVLVEDPDGNPVPNSQVNVTSSYDNFSRKSASSPPFPPSEKGWAKWFICTELIRYSASVTNYNPFNVSAENNSMTGYAFPEVTMNMSKDITVIVPFNPIPNLRPIVSWLTTPVGVQTGLVTIHYMLFDPDAYDNGSLMVKIYHSLDNITFWPSTQAGGDNTLNLYSNTSYTFIWNSGIDEGPLYDDTVWILIVPSDGGGNGSLSKTGSFTLDNAPPELISLPTVDVTNTTAIINWTVNEPANATVDYGLDGDITDQASGSTGSANQSVTLTDLQPGRSYNYTLSSTDVHGHKFTSDHFTFETEVHILLYKGWNMISIPPIPPDPNIEAVLAPISGQYTAVQWYDPNDPDDPWKHYVPGKPYGNDLSLISPLMGFWIHMKNDTTFIPDQDVPPKDSNDTIPLFKGWNLVGYPSVTTRDVDTALDGVPYDIIQTYDAATGQWLSYDPNTGSGDLTEMELGRGYWIHATAYHNWEIYYV